MEIIPYGKQFIDQADKKLVVKSLSKSLITTGPYVERFEKELKKYLKSNYSFVCNSGTAAIHLSMLALNLKKGDIILMPAINFISSYNMAKILQLRIFLVDVDKDTGQMTPDNVINCIKKNNLKKIKALITMYHGGYPENSKKFYDLKKKFNFKIIEDACHALGAQYKFKTNFYKIGSCKHSDICTFSLHPLKTITTGEGGIISTNNSKIAEKIKIFRSHGIVRHKKKYWKYNVFEHGYNYRLSDINCALGLTQLKKINFFLKKRRLIYNKYFKELKNFNKNLTIPTYSKNIVPSYHLFLIKINFNKLNKNKDHFIKYLNKYNIFAQYHYIPIYKFDIFKDRKTNLAGSEDYYSDSISIPIYVSLDKTKQEKVVNIIKNYIKIFSQIKKR